MCRRCYRDGRRARSRGAQGAAAIAPRRRPAATRAAQKVAAENRRRVGRLPAMSPPHAPEETQSWRRNASSPPPCGDAIGADTVARMAMRVLTRLIAACCNLLRLIAAYCSEALTVCSPALIGGSHPPISPRREP